VFGQAGGDDGAERRIIVNDQDIFLARLVRSGRPGFIRLGFASDCAHGAGGGRLLEKLLLDLDQFLLVAFLGRRRPGLDRPARGFGPDISFDNPKQLPRLIGFANVGGYPFLKAGLCKVRRADGRQSDDRDGPGRRVLLELDGGIEAVHIRQDHVQDDEVRLLPDGQVEPFLGLAREKHAMAASFETEPDELVLVGLILDNQDLGHRRQLPAASHLPSSTASSG